MAGSYGHCIDADTGKYRGYSLLENMGDMKEAVEEMVFIIGWLARNATRGGHRTNIKRASDEYFRCLRKEQPWPEWMKPGVETY